MFAFFNSMSSWRNDYDKFWIMILIGLVLEDKVTFILIKYWKLKTELDLKNLILEMY